MYALSLLVAAFVACFHLNLAQLQGVFNQTNVTFDDGNYNVSWMHNVMTDQLHFEVTVNTTGWVGFGFTFTPKGMLNYDLVVGGRTDAGQNYLNDFHTLGLGRPIRDTQQNYILESGSEQNGITSLRFRRPRVTNDAQDIQFNATTRVFLVWAYHTTQDADNPTMFSKHTFRNHTMEPVQLVYPMNMTMMMSTPEPTNMTTVTRRPSSGLQLGVGFLTISFTTILSILVG